MNDKTEAQLEYDFDSTWNDEKQCYNWELNPRWEYKEINMNLHYIAEHWNELAARSQIKPRDYAYVPPILPIAVSNNVILFLRSEGLEEGLSEIIKAMTDLLVDDRYAVIEEGQIEHTFSNGKTYEFDIWGYNGLIRLEMKQQA